MPESFPIWFPWVLGALTGGLSAAILNLIAGSLKSRNEKRQAKMAQINAVKQELKHALWVIEYNHGRIRSEGMPHKGLTTVVTANVERVLFTANPILSFQPDVLDQFRDYIQQVVYLNSLIAEQKSLVPNSVLNTAVETRLKDYLAEIKAICTTDDTYRENDPEPSLRVRVRRLIDYLNKSKL